MLAGRLDTRFTPLTHAPLLCDAGTVCWLRVTLAREPGAPTAWWLRLRTVRSGTLSLFASHGPATQGQAREVDGAPSMEMPRQFPLNWRYVDTEQFFPLALDTAPATFYLRMQDVLAADGLAVLQRTAFEHQQRQLAILLSVSLGVTLALMVLNLVFWRWLNDTLFLYFGAFLAAAVLLHLWQILPALHPEGAMGDAAARAALQALMQSATILFIARLFDLRQQLPWAQGGTRAYVLLNLALGAGALAGHTDALEPVVAVLDLAGMLFSMAAVGWLLFARQQWQLAWPAALTLVIAVTSGVGRLRWLGLIGPGPDEGLGLTWASVRLIYMLLLAIIVADRTRRAELQLRRSRQRALDRSQRMERLLEDAVRRRTEELHASNALLASEIERRREAEAGLVSALASQRRVLQQQREFVSLVSHEFRTPLAVIDAAAQSMGLPNVEQGPRLAKIRRAVDRLRLLVVNCLAEDRLRGGSASLRAEPVDLRSVMETVLAPLGGTERARVCWHAPAGPVPVRADTAMLDVAIHNLVQNALKYSPPDRPVTVRLRAHGSLARLEVEDQGGGVPPAERTRVFERYFRGEGSGGTSGTGLGLYLGAQIAAAHGGTLALLCSDAHGSVFGLDLPLHILEEESTCP